LLTSDIGVPVRLQFFFVLFVIVVVENFVVQIFVATKKEPDGRGPVRFFFFMPAASGWI